MLSKMLFVVAGVISSEGKARMALVDEPRSTLKHMAALVRLSPYYLARQLKRAPGLPPNQAILTHLVEQAQ